MARLLHMKNNTTPPKPPIEEPPQQVKLKLKDLAWLFTQGEADEILEVYRDTRLLPASKTFRSILSWLQEKRREAIRARIEGESRTIKREDPNSIFNLSECD